ncbi:MAG: hypothetical protein AAFX59_00090 [Pseudomonadota bacterium]
MRVLRALIVLVLLAGGALAQTDRVSVTAADHAGYTRLVIGFPTAPDWSLGQTDGGLTLRIAAPPLRYDVQGTLQSLSSDRVTALSQAPATGDLQIALSCACGVQAYILDARFLFIDIHQSADAGDPRFARALPEPVPPIAARRVARGDPDRFHAMVIAPVKPHGDLSNDDPPIVIPGSDAPPQGAIVLENLRLAQARLPTGETLRGPNALPFLPAPDALETRRAVTDALASEVARAATLGLLDPRRSSGAGATELQTDALGPEAPPNLRIDLGVDPSTGVGGQPRLLPQAACAPRGSYDIASWGPGISDKETPWKALAAARVALFDTLDAPRAQAVRDLARLYTYLTFGVEAQAVLASLAGPTPDSDRLVALARIVEAPDGGPLSGFDAAVACGPAPAMWALIAGTAPDNLGIDLNPMLLYFAGLPRHLRQHLGPRLADQLLDLGARDAALTVRNATPTTPFGPPPALQLLDGRLADLGLRLAPRPDLSALARSSSPEASAALIAIVDQAETDGIPVAEDYVASARLMSFERAGTADAAPLKEAEVRGRLTRDEFAVAVSTLRAARADGVIPTERAARLSHQVFTAATQRAPDAIFSQLVFDPANQSSVTGAAPDLRLAIGRRLADLGFTTRAADLIQSLPNRDAAEVRRVRARLALARGRPEEAAAAVSPAVSSDDARIAAEADLASGRFDDARDRCLSLGDADCATRAALRARDWPVLSRDRDGPVREAAVLIDATDPPVTDPPTLAETQATLDRVRDARGRIDALLSAIAPAEGNGS